MDNTTRPTGPLSGRRAEAARNDHRIREAARKVLLADPFAPIAAVAKQAGVGMAALYRRYANKDDLLRRLFLDSLQQEAVLLQAALADDDDPWLAFCRYAHGSLDLGSGLLSLHIPAAFQSSDEWRRANQTCRELVTRLVERNQAAGALRPDVEIGDIGWLFLPVQAIEMGDPLRNNQYRHRFLALVLDGLHTTAPTPLPGPPPGWSEFGERWEKSALSRPGDDAFVMQMIASATPAVSDRDADIDRHQRHILLAARAAFVSDPEAPMVAIAERAGVGVAALYRYFPSKAVLIQQLYLDGIVTILAAIELAMADPGDRRSVFRRFTHDLLRAGMGLTASRFVGAFRLSQEVMDRVREMDDAFAHLIRHVQAAGGLRSDVVPADLEWLFTPLYAIRVGDEERAANLRHRFLAIVLDGLQTPTPLPLPGTSMTSEGFVEYWNERFAKASDEASGVERQASERSTYRAPRKG